MKQEHKMKKVRAIELFSNNSPFKPKTVQSKKIYKRKGRTQKKDY